jgi:8-oxo-dGTP pyrophosphatase MutT (NUDIX family)
MRAGAIDPEMQRRFEASEKVRIGETRLRRPALRPSEESLRAHFASEVGRAEQRLENPHVEPRVTDAERASAVPAAVLVAVVLREPEPTVLVTKRHHGISYPGHWVFPGGRSDPRDATPRETALREAKEEIGLDGAHVEVLGRLGDYVSHGGFCIAPTVALVHPPIELTAQPGEVEAIAEIPLSRMLDSSSYLLYRFEGRQDRAHFALDADEILLTGVTASVCIGLYSELLKTHTAG